MSAQPPLRPTDQPPQLFDRALRARRRDRAAPQFAAADFLHRLAAEGVVERLEPILRPFPDALVAAGANGVYAGALAGRFGIERLSQIEASPRLAVQARAVAPCEIGDIDAGALAMLAPASLDLIVIGLDLHAANDPIGVLIQARMALKPDGLLLATQFAGDTLIELRSVLTDAEIEVRGGLSARVAPTADLRTLGSLLQRAGFALPAADSDRLTVWHRSPLDLMRELRAMGETNAMSGRSRAFLRRDLLGRALALYVDRYAREDGKTAATFEIAALAGWAPSADQQQPLRPGSAKSRLAEALGVAEHSAGEKVGGGGDA